MAYFPLIKIQLVTNSILLLHLCRHSPHQQTIATPVYFHLYKYHMCSRQPVVNQESGNTYPGQQLLPQPLDSTAPMLVSWIIPFETSGFSLAYTLEPYINHGHWMHKYEEPHVHQSSPQLLLVIRVFESFLLLAEVTYLCMHLQGIKQ